jgi:uncharacterized protein YceK
MKLAIFLATLISLSGCAYYTSLEVGGASYSLSTSVGAEKQSDAAP